MVEYIVRIQVIEKARREGIAEIETVRDIPEVVILSIDSDSWVNIGNAVSTAQGAVAYVRHRTPKEVRP